MRYFKILDKNGNTCGVGKNDNIGIEITEEEYNEAMKPIIDARKRRQAEIKEALELREAVLAAGFTLASKPTDLPSRAGFKWKPSLDLKGKSMGWQEVEDPNARGTKGNPFGWMPNMKVYANHWYKHRDIQKVCIRTSNATDFDDENYFDGNSMPTAPAD